MLLWWAKRSLPPSSGVMNPKPLESLNHFTVPVAIVIPFLSLLCATWTEARCRASFQGWNSTATTDTALGGGEVDSLTHCLILRAALYHSGGIARLKLCFLDRHVDQRRADRQHDVGVPQPVVAAGALEHVAAQPGAQEAADLV